MRGLAHLVRLLPRHRGVVRIEALACACNTGKCAIQSALTPLASVPRWFALLVAVRRTAEAAGRLAEGYGYGLLQADEVTEKEANTNNL